MTVVNTKGVHILVGIVSKRLGLSCREQNYTIFSNIAAFLPWIESTIRKNGGMSSCSFYFSALRSLGNF